MYEVFRAYLDSKISLTDQQHNWIQSFCSLKILRKNRYLLQEGDVWRKHAFISKGLVRAYTIDEKGFERVIQFARENYWTGDRESLLSGRPSTLNIDAIEDSEVVLIDDANFLEICRQIPAFNDMVHTILQRAFVVSQIRIHESISVSAEEKYRHFIERNPTYATRIPLSMIASYLGITRETLSRIRHKVVKKW